MVEHKDVLIHLDPQGDRVAASDLNFSGWIAANQAIKSVSIAAEKNHPLPLCQRPDVELVLPGRIAIGFSGTAKGVDLRADSLRLRVEAESETFEIAHPVPPALVSPPTAQRFLNWWTIVWLRLRERLTRDTSECWRLTLRRHLVYRRQRSGIFRRPHADALLLDFARIHRRAFFLQIGANDGFTGDPLGSLLASAGKGWRGVLVEPVAHLFAQLSDRYAQNRALKLERAAVGESDGEIEIYRLQTAVGDSLFLDQLPSLDREVVQRNASVFGAADSRIIAESVPSFCVATLLARHEIAQLDLLVIDTEGWDWRILRQFDLAALGPKLIFFEHQHLSTEDERAAQARLNENSYNWAKTPEGDTIAWRIV